MLGKKSRRAYGVQQSLLQANFIQIFVVAVSFLHFLFFKINCLSVFMNRVYLHDNFIHLKNCIHISIIKQTVYQINTVPCRTAFAKLEDLEIQPNKLSFNFMTIWAQLFKASLA